jgi:hypothetical protein
VSVIGSVAKAETLVVRCYDNQGASQELVTYLESGKNAMEVEASICSDFGYHASEQLRTKGCGLNLLACRILTYGYDFASSTIWPMCFA